MEILYLVFDSINSPIVRSQVYEMGCKIADKEDVKFKLITLEEEIGQENLHHKISIFPVKKSNFLISHLMMYIETVKIFFKGTDIIHVRSYLPMPIAIILKKLFGVKVIFDMRGLLPEEHIYLNDKKTNSINYRILKYMEKIFIKNADSIIVVSENFRDYVQSKYSDITNIQVIYCSANDKQIDKKHNISESEFRIKYDIDKNQITIAYVGSFYKYQQLDDIIKFISDAITSYNIKFLIFTKDTKEFVSDLLKKYNIPSQNVEINYLPTEILTNHLRYCDYGIIMRTSNIINKVSSPIKVSEYIMNDMKIIHSGNIGDFDEILEKFDCGINIMKTKLQLEKKTKNYRNPEKLKKLVSYEYNSDKYLNIYENLIKK